MELHIDNSDAWQALDHRVPLLSAVTCAKNADVRSNVQRVVMIGINSDRADRDIRQVVAYVAPIGACVSRFEDVTFHIRAE
jgi:hypothetical protein